MARGGFWDSFYQGWNQGDKITERNRGLQQRAQLKKVAEEDQVENTQYNQEDFTDDAEKSGGIWSEADQAYRLPDGSLQAPTNTPTWDEATKSYQGSQGQSLRPKTQFSLGGTTQDQRFTPEQVQDYRTNRIADVYASTGDIDKSMGVRASAQQMKLGKVQLEQADAAGREANNVRKLMKLQGDVYSGAIDPEEAIKQVIGVVDKANGDGITFAYKPVGDGRFEVTELHNDKIIGSKVVNPMDAIKAALKYSSPTMFAQMQGQENADRSFNQSDKQFTANLGMQDKRLAQDEKQFQQNMDFNMVNANEKRDLDLRQLAVQSRLADAQAGYYGSRSDAAGQPRGLNALEEYKLSQLKANEGVNPKAETAFYNFVANNPDATPEQIGALKRNLGLAPQLQYGEIKPAQGTLAPPQGLKKRPTFREAMADMSPDEIDKKAQNPYFDSQEITDEDRVYAAKMINAKRAAERLTPTYLR